MSNDDDARIPGVDVAAEGQRLLRVGGDKGPSLSERLGARLQHLGYRSPLHRLRLRGRFPLRLVAVPADPIAGDAGVGERLLAGRLVHAGHNAGAATAAFDDPAAPPAWRDWVNGFAWLRDLAAATERGPGARVAEPLVARWLDANAEFDAASWRPDLCASRLLFGAAYAPYILASNDHVYRSAVLNAMARWARHLDRAVDKCPDGIGRVTAFAGMVAAGLLIAGGETRQARGEAGLAKALEALLLPDGGIATRAPVDQIVLLELLLLLEAVYAARREPAAAPVGQALARLLPALKAMTMGDGRPGHWHGSSGIDAGRVAAALALAGGDAVQPARHGADSGYQRLTAGGTILVVDAGPPPVARVAVGAHAGTLAFELSDGPQPLVVNCGGARGLPRQLSPELAAGLRTTAAHSTLVLDDINSTRIRPDGALGRGVEEVVTHRQESEEGHWLDLAHDGYARRHGVRHRRRLFLSADGTDLRGEDALEPLHPRRKPVGRIDVRFHLGAGIEALPTADGLGALLRLPSGRVWQFRARGGALAVEASLWIADDCRSVPTQQLVVSARAEEPVSWSFKRSGK